MQAFNFGIQNPSGPSPEDFNSRYHIPSSIYSGPGPAEEDTDGRISVYGPNGLRNPFEEDRPRYNPLNKTHPHSSSLLNISDPVAMHLLTETAIGDSKEYEVLSFEELEQLKKEKVLLRSRIEGIKRKLALETKLRDAAQSLNRLYTTRGRPEDRYLKPDASSRSPRRRRRSMLGSRDSSTDALNRSEDEFAASNRKVEEFTQELDKLEKRLEEIQRRILEHTAGVLSVTHKGLKRNLRKHELPRSPESMASQTQRNGSGTDEIDEFDERSLYQIPDYVTDFGISHRSSANGHREIEGDSALDAAEQRLFDLSKRLHNMILQTDPDEQVDAPPHALPRGIGNPGSRIQAHLGYLSSGLDSIEAAQAKIIAEAQKSMFDSEDQLEEVNVRLHDLLEKTNDIGHGPLVMHGESRGKSMQSQLSFSAMVLDRLNERIELLVEQKDILTRQIQQQRELNSKSDSERDAHILHLTEQLTETRRLHAIGEQESQAARGHMNMLMEQLDQAKQESLLNQQRQSMDQNKALESEKIARKETEQRLLAELKVKQEEHGQLRADLANLQNDVDSKVQTHAQQLAAVTKAKEENGIELEKHRTLARELQDQVESYRADIESQSQRHAQQIGELTIANDAHKAEIQRSHAAIENLNKAKAEIDGLKKAKVESETELERNRKEMKDLESEVVRVQTELTMVKAELDGAYGTRAQRAADVSMNPAIQKEIDDLNDKNSNLQRQLDFLRTEHEAKGAGIADLKNEVNSLQRELKDTIEDYEMMTKSSIEFEKERDQLEATIDNMRERVEALETQLSDEKVKWLGAKTGATVETTSTMVLKNEFKKMMRDTRAENVKALRAEQEERRRLEGVIRGMKKELHEAISKSPLSQTTASPAISYHDPQ